MVNATLVAGLAIMAGVWAWAIHIYGRVNRHVAPLLEAGRVRWDVWHGAIVLDGMWNHAPVQIRSEYMRPPRLSVTMGVVTRPPDLDARLDRSGNMFFRSIRKDRLGIRTLARAGEAELRKPEGRRADIAAYFTPTRLQSLRVLLSDLKWQRFLRNKEGIAVSKFGTEGARWKSHEARERVLATLVQLQNLERGV
jgi:hypothetical protein